MGVLIQPTKRQIKGPWLLNQRDLEKLDDIINFIREKLNKAQQEEIKLNNSFNNKDRNDLTPKIIFVSKNNNKIIDESIKNILKDSNIKEFKTSKIEINIGNRYYGYEFLLSLESKFDGDLDYFIECNDRKVLDEILYSIDQWIDEFGPKKINQLFSSFLFKYTSILLIFFFFIISLNSSIRKDLNQSQQNVIRLTDSLTKVGIDSSNQYLALKVILKYQQESFSRSESPTYFDLYKILKFLIILLIALIIICTTPKTTIGIGKNKGKYKFYILWQKIIFYILPILIVLPLLSDIIKNYLFN